MMGSNVNFPGENSGVYTSDTTPVETTSQETDVETVEQQQGDTLEAGAGKQASFNPDSITLPSPGEEGLSYIAFLTMIDEMIGVLQEALAESDIIDVKSLQEQHEAQVDAAGSLRKLADLLESLDQFKNETVAEQNGAIKDLRKDLKQLHKDLKKFNKEAKNKTGHINSVIEEYNSRDLSEMKPEARQRYTWKVNRKIRDYNNWVARNSGQTDAMIAELKPDIEAYNETVEDYNGDLSAINQKLNQAGVNENVGSRLEEIAYPPAEASNLTRVRRWADGINDIPTLPAPTFNSPKDVRPEKLNLDRDIKQAKQATLSKFKDKLKLLQAFVNATDINEESIVQNRTNLPGFDFAETDAFFQLNPELFYLFGFSNAPLSLSIMGGDSDNLDNLASIALLQSLAISGGTPVPSTAFEQLELYTQDALSNLSMLSVPTAFSLVGAHIRELEPSGFAINASLGIGLASQILNFASGSEIRSAISQVVEQAVSEAGSDHKLASATDEDLEALIDNLTAGLTFSLTAQALNGLSHAIGLPGLAGQVLANVLGLEPGEALAYSTPPTATETALNNPGNILSLKSTLTDSLKEASGKSGEEAAIISNEAVNQALRGNPQTLEELETALAGALEQTGLPPSSAADLASTGALVVQAGFGNFYLDLTFQPIRDPSAAASEIIADAITDDRENISNIFRESFIEASKKDQFRSNRAFWHQLVRQEEKRGIKKELAQYYASLALIHLTDQEILPPIGIEGERLSLFETALIRELAKAAPQEEGESLFRSAVDRAEEKGPYSTEAQFIDALRTSLYALAEEQGIELGNFSFEQAAASIPSSDRTPLTEPVVKQILDPEEIESMIREQIEERMTPDIGADESKRVADSVVALVLGSLAADYTEGAAVPHSITALLNRSNETLSGIESPEVSKQYDRRLKDFFTTGTGTLTPFFNQLNNPLTLMNLLTQGESHPSQGFNLNPRG